MKTTYRIALGAALLLVAAAAMPQAHAACGSGGIMTMAQGSLFLDIPGLVQPCAGYTYLGAGGDPTQPDQCPTLTLRQQASYWKLGAGNPTLDLGVDDGGVPFITNGTGAYPGGEFAAVPGYFLPAVVNGSPWAASGDVDGCPHEPPDLNACVCVLITDQFQGEGYYAIMAAANDGADNYSANLPQGSVALAPLPRPIITNSAKAGDNVDLTVELEALGAGVYESGCGGCTPGAYKIVAKETARGVAPDEDRSTGWTELTLADGVTPQPALGTAAGDQVSVRGNCAGGNRDLYIAAELLFPDGYTGQNFSSNATKVECGPVIADPGTPRVRPIRPRPAGARPGKAGGR